MDHTSQARYLRRLDPKAKLILGGIFHVMFEFDQTNSTLKRMYREEAAEPNSRIYLAPPTQ